MQLHMFPEGLHNSISRHQDQKTYQITNAFGDYLEFSFHKIISP